MGKFDKSQILTAVEFGTSKISVAIARRDKNGKLHVLAHSSLPSNGTVIKGEIVNIHDATQIFQEVLTEAETVSGIGECDPENVFVAITGNHISSREGTGTILINNPEHRVEKHHIAEVQTTASVTPLSDEIRKIDSIAVKFLLDSIYCDTPLDRIGTKLEAYTHIIVGSKSKIENSLIPIKDTHCDNPKPTFSGLASAWVGINDSEQEKGVLFIDFGAGTTEYLLLQPPDFFASGVIAVGCDHIVNDLALVLELSFHQGQDIFKKFLEIEELDGNPFIEVTHDLISINHKSRKIPFDTINDVVELRIEELFKVIKKEIRKKIPTSNPAANYVVITGGGSLIPITKAKANEVFKTPVRINTTNNMRDFSHFPEELTSPKNSTVAGLLVHASKLSNKSSFVNMLDRSITVQISELFKKIKTAFKI